MINLLRQNMTAVNGHVIIHDFRAVETEESKLEYVITRVVDGGAPLVLNTGTEFVRSEDVFKAVVEAFKNA